MVTKSGARRIAPMVVESSPRAMTKRRGCGMPDSGHLVAELNGHANSVRSATYSPDGRRIVTASDDKTARVWDADSGRLVAELKDHGDKVLSAMYSPNGRPHRHRER